MHFSGEFELEGVTPEEAWLVLTDPIAIEEAAPGCKYVRPIEGEDHEFDEYEPEDVPMLPEADRDLVAGRAFEEGRRYAAFMKVGVGDITPTFESVVTIDEMDYLSMEASGNGATVGSAFEMTSSASVSGSENGAIVEWEFETDISGRVAQINQNVLESVADRTVQEFFDNVQQQMYGVTESAEAPGPDERSGGFGARIRGLVGDLFGAVFGRTGA